MPHSDTSAPSPDAEAGAPEAEAEAPGGAPGKRLTEAAKRALAEAAARRVTEPVQVPGDEKGGSQGLEPTRFGDWERKGVAYDF